MSWPAQRSERNISACYIEVGAHSELQPLQSGEQPPAIGAASRKFSVAAGVAVAIAGFTALGFAVAHVVTPREPEALLRSVGQKIVVSQPSAQWQCQRYTDEQDEAWCTTARQEGGYNYTLQDYDGPKANFCKKACPKGFRTLYWEFSYKLDGDSGTEVGQCAECFCCKQHEPKSPAPQLPPQGSKPKPALPPQSAAVPTPAPTEAKKCGSLDEDCAESLCCEAGLVCDTQQFSQLTKKGLREKTQRFCSKDLLDRASQHSDQSHQALKKALDDSQIEEDTEPQVPGPWQCHDYEDGQDDTWCQSVGNQSGFEYWFAGADPGGCAPCWCCKRELPPEKQCSKAGDDCRTTSCCEQPGFQCYERDSSSAVCKSTCTEEGWSCRHLGERRPTGIGADGAGSGEICAVVGKCKHPGYQCYQMNDYFSTCKASCTAEDWSCKEYGNRTPAIDDPTHTDCAWGGDLCSPLGCCVGEGLQCYERDEYWASCMHECDNSMDLGSGPEKWSCKKRGSRRKVDLGCTWMNEECTGTKLCCHPGFSCVQRDDRRAFCTKEQYQEGWDGTVLGGSREEWPVQPVPAGSENESGTSLFCFMAVLPDSEEVGLRWAAENKNASIFACEEHGVYDSWQSARGDAGDVSVAQSWGSVVNTDVFFKVWQEVLADGRYKNHDWSVKVDPDAVFFADRLRYKLGNLHAPKGWPIYIKNTEKSFGFLGACEVLSVEAVRKYSLNDRECFASISANSGEDGYIKGCMDMIGAGYMLEFDVLRTPWWTEACTDPSLVTFHPFKDVGAWDQCYNEAVL